MFNSYSINVPLVEALEEIRGYAKFMKELVTKKKTLECKTIKVSYHWSEIVTNTLVAKKDDPSTFTIPYTIRVCKFGKALSNLGASINLMNLTIFDQLGCLSMLWIIIIIIHRLSSVILVLMILQVICFLLGLSLGLGQSCPRPALSRAYIITYTYNVTHKAWIQIDS